MTENGSQSSFELLDALAELEEVIVKLTLLNVHNVISDRCELVTGLDELSQNGSDRVGQGLTLSVSDLDLVKLHELLNGASQLHNILAAFLETIKANKERV